MIKKFTHGPSESLPPWLKNKFVAWWTPFLQDYLFASQLSNMRLVMAPWRVESGLQRGEP